MNRENVKENTKREGEGSNANSIINNSSILKPKKYERLYKRAEEQEKKRVEEITLTIS